MPPYNSVVYYDDFSYQNKPEMRDFVENTFLISLLESIKMKCVLVLWWDGTMLRAIGEYSHTNIPILWINFGHKWFLLNDMNWVSPDIPNFETREYPLLKVRNNWEEIGTAFNDVHMYSPEWKAISLRVKNGSGTLDLWWDGMILATPAGSTGHSKSYGWPILPHKSENLVITPKWNITPQSSKALDDSELTHITNTGRKFPLAINIDGSQVYVSDTDEDVALEVSKSSRSVHLLIAKKHLRDWDNKVLTEQGFTI